MVEAFIYTTAADYQQDIKRLQDEGWRLMMTNFVNNQWVVTAEAQTDLMAHRKTLKDFHA